MKDKETKKTSEIKIKKITKDKTEGKKKVAKWLLLALILIIIFCLTTLIVFGVGIYKFNWNDKFTNKLITYIPYPAAMVDNRIISWSDYRDDIKAMEIFVESEEGKASGLTKENLKDMGKSILGRQIEYKIINQLAEKYDAKVTNTDIDLEFQTMTQASGQREDIVGTIKKLYGWTLDEFKEKVLKPQIQYNKLYEKYSTDINIDRDNKSKIEEEARKKAEKALVKVNAGEDFAKVAEEYSEDYTSAANGGDLGFISRGQMVASFEEAAFSLEPGQVSNLVRTNFGYHIIKLEEKKAENNVEQVHVRHILISVEDRFTQWLDEYLKEANIYVFVPDLVWNKETLMVEDKGAKKQEFKEETGAENQGVEN